MRLAIIGANRGKLLFEYSNLDSSVSIVAVCDSDSNTLSSMSKSIFKFTKYTEICEHVEFDAVYIATPPDSHAEISAYFLQRGISVLCEVPACLTEAEANLLREAQKKSSAIYMMAENYCYIPENLAIKKIIQSGKLGEIVFIEGKYIHDCKEYFVQDGNLTWRGLWNSGSMQNHYPTHSLGPICQWLGVGTYGKDSLVSIQNSVTSNLALKKDWEEKKIDYPPTQGDIVFSKIKTKNNVTIHLRYDTKSNRPNLKNGYEIQGTLGWIQSGRFDEETPIIYYKEEQKIIALRDTREYKETIESLPFDYDNIGRSAVNYTLFFYFIKSLNVRKSQIPLDDSLFWSSPLWSN